MRHTFVCSAGRRITFGPSPIDTGMLQLQVLDADKKTIAQVDFEAAIGEAIASALELEVDCLLEALDPALYCPCGVATKDKPCLCAQANMEFSAKPRREVRG